MTDTIDLGILDMDVGAVQAYRLAPHGWYSGVVVDVEIDKIPNAKQTQYADISVKLIDPLEGQDLTGVKLDRPLKKRLWLTTDSASMTKTDLEKVTTLSTGKFRDAIEALTGVHVKVNVRDNDYQAKKGRVMRELGDWASI